MTTLGFLIIIAYITAFFIYNGILGIKEKFNNQMLYKNKSEKIITTIIAIICIWVYFYDWSEYKLDYGYNFIINHPTEYLNYLENKHIKQKQIWQKHLDKLENGQIDESQISGSLENNINYYKHLIQDTEPLELMIDTQIRRKLYLDD